MKKEDVKINGYYFVNVDGEEEIVRIIRESSKGFIAELMTGKKVQISIKEFTNNVPNDIEVEDDIEESNLRRSPIVWLGGKGLLKTKNFILENMPPHDKYVEPFGGGASILIAKRPVSVEVYNDLNSGLVNFFKTVSNEETFQKFYERVNKLPVSRGLFKEFCQNWHLSSDPIEQALRWFTVARQSFGGMFGSSWAISVNSSNSGMSMNVASWLSSIKGLPEVHSRMQRVTIENSDWRNILKSYNGKGWLAYCDPPYVAETRKAGNYKHELDNKDHKELVDTFLKYDGAIMLSGYDTPLYKPLIDAGWNKKELSVVCTAAGRTRASGLQGNGKVSEEQKRVEVLWRNPEAMRRIEEEKNKKKAPSLF